jgi:hypothetical protein
LRGSSTRTSQSTTPFQCGIGSLRRLNLRPTTGWKSFFISHASISGPCVSARQIFSGGWAITRSTTTDRLAALAGRLSFGISVGDGRLADDVLAA